MLYFGCNLFHLRKQKRLNAAGLGYHFVFRISTVGSTYLNKSWIIRPEVVGVSLNPSNKVSDNISICHNHFHIQPIRCSFLFQCSTADSIINFYGLASTLWLLRSVETSSDLAMWKVTLSIHLLSPPPPPASFLPTSVRILAKMNNMTFWCGKI
jgi:hypothetical protein